MDALTEWRAVDGNGALHRLLDNTIQSGGMPGHSSAGGMAAHSHVTVQHHTVEPPPTNVAVVLGATQEVFKNEDRRFY
jgi:hypothetical protein